MRVRFSYRVKGLLRLDERDVITFTINDATYEIRTEKRRVSNLSITYANIPEDQWPLVVENPEPSIAVELRQRFHAKDPRQVAQRFANLLAVFGCDGIDEAFEEEKWLPENPEEAAKLDMNSGTWDESPRTIDDVEPTPEGLFFQVIASADQDESEELELAFFRLGVQATQQRRYIEAFYHFFFILETNFSGGKFKTKELVKNFLASQDLVQDISDVVGALPGSMVGVQRDLAEKVIALYACKDAKYVIERLVGRRGFLHHHTRKDRGHWHPDRTEEFYPDIYIAQQVAFKSVWRVLHRRLWSDRVLHICSNLQLLQSAPPRKSRYEG
jgi:hypothetical protein